MACIDEPRGTAVELVGAAAQLLEPLSEGADLGFWSVALDDADEDQPKSELARQRAGEACRPFCRLRVVDTANDRTGQRPSFSPGIEVRWAGPASLWGRSPKSARGGPYPAYRMGPRPDGDRGLTAAV
jgi:hypothetical protein